MVGSRLRQTMEVSYMPRFIVEQPLEGEFQPYFKAFLLHMGLFPGDETSTYEYIMWNQSKWSEWRQLNGIDERCNMTDKNHQDFEKWLLENVPITEGVAV